MDKSVSKRKKRTKRLFLAILMILFTAVVLTASTYAWFTSNRTVTVSQIDVNVAAANGLQVSVDGINWKTIINNNDITGAGTTYSAAVNQLPSSTYSIVPTSTIGAIDSTTGFMNMYKGEITSNALGNYILTATKTTETHSTTTGDFIVFDLFFQTNQDTAVYLTSNSNVVALNTSTGIENASRVAFVPQGHADTGATTATIQALKNDGTVAPIIWEPNYDVHTAAAVMNASDVYGITTTQTGGSRLTYVGVKAAIADSANIPLNSTDNTYFGAVTPTIATTASGIPTTAYQQVFSLVAGTTKMRIYMWVEGQDVDCENNASGGSLSYNLQFSTLSAA